MKLKGKQANKCAENILKEYPKDYTQEEREMIKELVIARIKQTPSNWRLSVG